jgi:hypothetical protein
VALICAAGQECAPAPKDVLRGRGLCSICARKDPAAAEAAFRARVEDLGARPAPGARYAPPPGASPEDRGADDVRVVVGALGIGQVGQGSRRARPQRPWPPADP